MARRCRPRPTSAQPTEFRDSPRVAFQPEGRSRVDSDGIAEPYGPPDERCRAFADRDAEPGGSLRARADSSLACRRTARGIHVWMVDAAAFILEEE
jgi:hypothetical protein